jgi:hypothetical protein
LKSVVIYPNIVLAEILDAVDGIIEKVEDPLGPVEEMVPSVTRGRL